MNANRSLLLLKISMSRPRVCLLPVIVFASVLVPEAQAMGQSQAIVGGDDPLVVLARIEKEGAAHPRQSKDPGFSLFREFGYRGGGDRVCRDVASSEPIWSGDFAIGGSIGSDSPFPLESPHGGKIWWVPAASWDSMTLVVRGRNLDPPYDGLRFEIDKIAYPGPPTPLEANQERDWFFPTGIAIPSEGRWALVGTSGGNWGCFIVHVS